MPHFTMFYHAAMAGRSSLLAAVIRHTRSRAASFSVITGPDWHTPAQMTRSSPPHQEKTSAHSSLAQSDDADRSLSAVDRSSLRHLPLSLSTSSALSEKVGSGLSKRPPYSGVQRCRQLHAAITHAGEKSSMASPTTAHLSPVVPTPRHWPTVPMGTTTPTPALPPSPPVPAPSQFFRSMASPNRARPAQLYSCGIQQRRRPTPAYNVRHWPATCANNHH